MDSLIIDTASNLQFLALYDSKTQNYDIFTQVVNRDHSEIIDENLGTVLNRNNCKIDDLKQIYVNLGPGSYTGLRVGLTVAKTIAYFANKKLYTFYSNQLSKQFPYYQIHSAAEFFCYQQNEITMINSINLPIQLSTIVKTMFYIENNQPMQILPSIEVIIQNASNVEKSKIALLEPEYFHPLKFRKLGD